MSEYRSLAVALIDPSPFNPRKRFTNLEGLGASIKANGLVEPLLVRPKGDRFELIAGERRLRAAKLVELVELPCVVRVIADRDALELAVLENLQRESMEPLEEAEGFGHLLEQGYTVENLAGRVGCSKSQIYNRLSLRKLSPSVSVAVGQGFLEASVAQRFVKFSHEDQDEALKRVLTEDGKPKPVKEAVKVLKGFEDELVEAETRQQAAVTKGRNTRAQNAETYRNEERAKLAKRKEEEKRFAQVFWQLVRPALAADEKAGLRVALLAATYDYNGPGVKLDWLKKAELPELLERLVSHGVSTCYGDELREPVARAVVRYLGLDLDAALKAAEPPTKQEKPAKLNKGKKKGGKS